MPRRDVMEARSQAPSMAQSLNLMNGEEVEDKVRAKENVLSQLLDAGRPDAEVLKDLYVRAFSRPPSSEEAAAIEQYVAAETKAGRDRRRAYENILWAILNSKEFQLNR